LIYLLANCFTYSVISLRRALNFYKTQLWNWFACLELCCWHLTSFLHINKEDSWFGNLLKDALFMQNLDKPDWSHSTISYNQLRNPVTVARFGQLKNAFFFYFLCHIWVKWSATESVLSRVLIAFIDPMSSKDTLQFRRLYDIE
jgi:hypothetical protein